METFIVLDYLPNGHPLSTKPMHLREPIMQVMSEEYLVLLEVVPQQNYHPELRERLSNEAKDKIRRVVGRIDFDRLSSTAKSELELVVEDIIHRNEKKFSEFFNKAYPLTTRLHSLELLQGIGKKHMWDIIDGRKIKPFGSFEELKERVKLLPDLKKAIAKRIIEELHNKDRYYLFVQPPIRREERW